MLKLTKKKNSEKRKRREISFKGWGAKNKDTKNSIRKPASQRCQLKKGWKWAIEFVEVEKFQIHYKREKSALRQLLYPIIKGQRQNPQKEKKKRDEGKNMHKGQDTQGTRLLFFIPARSYKREQPRPPLSLLLVKRGKRSADARAGREKRGTLKRKRRRPVSRTQKSIMRKNIFAKLQRKKA